jgi:hypothetical protein
MVKRSPELSSWTDPRFWRFFGSTAQFLDIVRA